jgi:hypothetical protein
MVEHISLKLVLHLQNKLAMKDGKFVVDDYVIEFRPRSECAAPTHAACARIRYVASLESWTRSPMLNL